MLEGSLSRRVRNGLYLLSVAAPFASGAVISVPASDPRLRWEARTIGPDSGYRDVGWSASRVVLGFRGTGIRAVVDSGRTWWNLTLDKTAPRAVRPSRTDTLRLVEGLSDGNHELVLSKRTEPFVGTARIHGFLVDGPSPQLLAVAAASKLRIEFIGNSITCGYGVHAADPGEGFQDSSEDAEASASARAARALGAEFRVACYSGYGVFRDIQKRPNTLPGIYDRADPNQNGLWDHSKWHPDIIVINLGTNDYAKGIPDSAAFSKAYSDFITHLVAIHPGVAIALLHGPMLADDFPYDSLGRPIPSSSSLKNRIVQLVKTLSPKLGVPMDTIVLTPQSPSVGWGGDYHPNMEQSRINGLELEAGLRKAFPSVISRTTSHSRPSEYAEPASTWTGEGPWIATIYDIKGRVVSRSSGRGPGTLFDLAVPHGLHIVRIRQDDQVRSLRTTRP